MTEDVRPPPSLHEIERGVGEWGRVPQCVRDTLVAILGSPHRDAPPAVLDDAERTLLPLRRKGPKTDITATLEALLEAPRPAAAFVPNLQRPVAGPKEAPAVESAASPRGCTGRSLCNDADRDEADEEEKLDAAGSRGRAVREPRLLSDRRVFYGTLIDPAPESPRRDRASSSRGCAIAAQKKRSRVVRPIAVDAPTVKKLECIRHRREVRDVLLRVHCEIERLQGEADAWLVKSVYDAMRLDLRRAKDVYGEVKPLPHPTEEQEQALAAFAEGLAVLQDATVELVATFLSPEEKRFLGVDTHKYQTRAQRSTTYQYAPAAETKRRGQATGKRASECVSATTEAEDAARHKSPRNGSRGVASAPATATAAAPRPVSAVATAVVPPADAGEHRAGREQSGAAAANPPRRPRVKRRSQSKPSQRPPADSPPLAATASAPPVTEGKTALSGLPQLDKFGLRPTPAAAAAATTAPAPAKVQGRMKKSVTVAPAAPVERHLSCSTLSTRSTKSPDNRVGAKQDTVAREAAAPARPTIGLGRLDIKRFLIDSDSDSNTA
ncbi:uncharacterized protein Tco025E_06362 [Trypanosoma conorhini]|uniref:Uncharacterized protein n=1 Tax=Trypanosoma conorhini TaxID=83891 RepID=A0A3R7NWS9_9TRYP|nr:uncharacterized protein Tco025E_06362 [Trypanosoma conorhini]RNF13055.1 hypothetical protein Tco025E_06362 [Trypanosoma conorhini]